MLNLLQCLMELLVMYLLTEARAFWGWMTAVQNLISNGQIISIVINGETSMTKKR